MDMDHPPNAALDKAKALYNQIFHLREAAKSLQSRASDIVEKTDFLEDETWSMHNAAVRDQSVVQQELDSLKSFYVDTLSQYLQYPHYDRVWSNLIAAVEAGDAFMGMVQAMREELSTWTQSGISYQNYVPGETVELSDPAKYQEHQKRPAPLIPCTGRLPTLLQLDPNDDHHFFGFTSLEQLCALESDTSSANDDAERQLQTELTRAAEFPSTGLSMDLIRAVQHPTSSPETQHNTRARRRRKRSRRRSLHSGVNNVHRWQDYTPLHSSATHSTGIQQAATAELRCKRRGI